MYTRDISPNVLAQLPAMPPPLGVKSNFDNPPNHDISLIVTNTFFLAMMLSVVTIRIYTRSVIIHEIGWDDYTCAMAAAVSVITSALTLNSLRFGYGRHLWDIRAVALIDTSVLQTIASTAVAAQVVIFLVKISIFFQYLRLFGTDTRIRKLVYFGLLFIILFHASTFGVSLSVLVVCDSPKNNFTHTLCNDVPAILIFQGIFNVLSDFYIFFIPIPCIINLHVSKRQKMGLLFIFLAGFVTCLVSIARVINGAITFHGQDTLWNASLSSGFTTVELNLAIITSCIPTLPKFMEKITGSSIYRSLRTRLFSGRGHSHITKSSRGTTITENPTQGPMYQNFIANPNTRITWS